MKTRIFAAMLAVVGMFVFSSALTSCDSTSLGLDEENIKKPSPDTPEDPDAIVKIEGSAFDFNGEVEDDIVFNGRGHVDAQVNTYLGSTMINSKRISDDLLLNAVGQNYGDFYVSSAALLEAEPSVRLSEMSNRIPTTKPASAGTLVTDEFSQALNLDGRDGLLNFKEDRIEYGSKGDTIMPYAKVLSPVYLGAEFKLDEVLSNNDSTVMNCHLLVKVPVELEREVKSRSVDAEVQDYFLKLAFRRIYKNAGIPEEDKFLEPMIVSSRHYLDNGMIVAEVVTADVWSISGQKNVQTWVQKAPFGVTAPAFKTITSKNADYQTTGNGISGAANSEVKDGNWTIISRSQKYSSHATNGYNPFDNDYSVLDAKMVFNYKDLTIEFPFGEWRIDEANTSITNNGVSGNFDVYSYVNNIDYVYTIPSDSYRSDANAEAKILVEKAQPQDEFVKNDPVDGGVKDEIIDNFRVITITYEPIWSVSGRHEKVTEVIKLPIVFNNPSMQTIYTSNTSYSTRSNAWKAGAETSRKEGNFSVTTRSSSYSSTATNNDKSFNNVYTMSDSKVSYRNANLSYDFAYGNWNVVEGESTVGSATAEGDYNVSMYTNKVSYTYSITNDSKNGNGVSNVKLYVEKPVEKIIPEAWGKIIGAGISAVPSDDLGTSTNVAKKCLTIRTDKGAVAVVFDWNNNICSVSNVLAGNFVEGNFGAEYNSGYWKNGKWVPAEARDMSDRIAYYDNGKCVRNVRFSTLEMWNWANGHSTVVNGYTFNVTAEGVLTVSYNGQAVLSVR